MHNSPLKFSLSFSMRPMKMHIDDYFVMKHEKILVDCV